MALRSSRTLPGQLYAPDRALGFDRQCALAAAVLRRELGFANDLSYDVRGQVRPWSYANVENQYLNVAEELRRAMSENPYLRVFVASGYYDLATPYFAMDYTINQMQLDPAVRPNISAGYYESGHMMYIHEPSLVKLKQDIAGFYRAALGAPAPVAGGTPDAARVGAAGGNPNRSGGGR
jgi:carboxypeptidase C (cathepsin A)